MADELTALRTIKTFNDLAKRAADKGSETLSLIWKAGETAKEAKESLPHGEWMPFVEKHYTVDHRSVTRWIKFHESVPPLKLDTVSNLTACLKMIEPSKPTAPTAPTAETPKKEAVQTDPDPVEERNELDPDLLADRAKPPISPEPDQPCPDEIIDQPAADVSAAAGISGPDTLDWLYDVMWGEPPETLTRQQRADAIALIDKLELLLWNCPRRGKPTLDAATAYVVAHDLKVDPVDWYDEHEANDWKYGDGLKKPIKSWQRNLRKWHSNAVNRNSEASQALKPLEPSR